MLLNKQKNELFKIVETNNLSPDLFVVSEELMYFVITLRDTNLRFCVGQHFGQSDLYVCRYTLIASIHSQDPRYHNPDNASFIEIQNIFGLWLNENVIPYLENFTIPDLWAEMKNVNDVFKWKSFSSEDYVFFSTAERTQIKESIDRLEVLLINEYSPTKEQTIEINGKLTYLKIAVDRLNKFDWKSVAITTVIGIATTMAVDTTTGGRLWSLLQQAFGPVIKLLTGG